MRTNSQNIQLGLIASDTGQKLRHLVEALFVAATVIFLTGVALKEYEIQAARARVSEALFLVSTARVDLVAYRAEYGRWPVDATQAGNGTLAPLEGSGRYVSTLALREDGIIDVTMNQDEAKTAISGELLSFRIGLPSMDTGAPIIFTCGGSKPPPGFHVAGSDKTSISSKYLPYICTEH